MRLYLINPANPLALSEIRKTWLNRYRIWKPLGLMTVAALTPGDWEVTIFDENLETRDYAAMPRPDLVGITAFSSQASRAYELARQFRAMGVPVVMGGIHASMCTQEAMEHVDCVVVGEAETVWAQVLADASAGRLKSEYHAQAGGLEATPPARHDLLPSGYAFGAIQTTRGCPLNCSFCSVSAFNGTRYRNRSIENVIAEFKLIGEKLVLVVDDNLIGTSVAHISRAKELFRAMIEAKLDKKWIAQVTVNMGDDDELLDLAAKAGCAGVFIGFESPTAQGLAEVGKKFNINKGRDPRASVQRIKKHGILAVGSFIMGLDTDEPGIGRLIADTGRRYGLDIINVLFLTPLPGTRVWKQMQEEGRIAARDFPEDWKYFTLTFPVADYKQLSQSQIIQEMQDCDQTFYSLWRIGRRMCSNLWRKRQPLIALVSNLSYRASLSANRQAYREFARTHGQARPQEAAAFPESLINIVMPSPQV